MYYVQIISTYRLFSKYLSFQIIAQVLQDKTLIFFIKTELLQWKLVYTFIQKFDIKIEVKFILQRTTWTFTKNVLSSEFLLKWKCWRINHYLFQSPKKNASSYSMEGANFEILQTNSIWKFHFISLSSSKLLSAKSF